MKSVFKLCVAIVLLAGGICSSSAAQTSGKQKMSREQLAKAQAQNIANELAFDDATTAKFIETYSQCQQEVWAIKGKKTTASESKQSKVKTDAEIEQEIKNQFDRSQKILDLRRKYYDKYRAFLTPKQIQRIYQLEKKGMRQLTGKHCKNLMKQSGKSFKGTDKRTKMKASSAVGQEQSQTRTADMQQNAGISVD